MVKILSIKWIFITFFAQVYFNTCTNAKSSISEVEFTLRTIFLSINSTINPCNNFYGFACKSWAWNNFYQDGFLPPGVDFSSSNFYDNSRLLEDRVDAQLKDILEENHRKSGSQTTEGIFYQKCLDQEKLHSFGHWPMSNLLHQASNGHPWPVLYSHPQSDHLPSWDRLLSTFHLTLDVSPLIAFTPYSSSVHLEHRNKIALSPPLLSETFVNFSTEEMIQLMTFWENPINDAGGVNHRNHLQPYSFMVTLRALEVMQLQYHLQIIKTPEITEEIGEVERSVLETGWMTMAQFEAWTKSSDHYHHWTYTFIDLLRQSMDQLWSLVNVPKVGINGSRMKFYSPRSDFHKVHTTLEVLQLARQLAVSGKRISKNDPNALKLARLAALLDHSQLEQITAWMTSTNSSNNNFTNRFSKEKYESYFTQSFSYYQPEEDLILVYDLAYFRRLIPLMEATPRHVIFNYLALHAISKWRNYIGGPLLNTIAQSGNTPLWKHCVQRTKKVFPWTMSHWYLLKNNQQSLDKFKRIKQKVSRMVAIAKDHFDAVIRSADWLDEQTRAAALDKLHSTRAFIAYPDWLLKQYEEQLERSQVRELQQTDLLSLAVQKVSFDRAWRHLLLYDAGRMAADASSPPPSVDFDGWSETPIKVTAYHTTPKNSITIPIAYLQPPIFTYLDEEKEEEDGTFRHFHHQTAADLLNTGSLLPVIAHELLHGFEQLGSNYDREGFFSNWWTPQSRENLMTRSQCLLRQYQNEKVVFEGFKAEEEKRDGKERSSYGSFRQVYKTFLSSQTLIEDTADNGALKVAYGAFLQWKQQNRSKSNQLRKRKRRFPSFDSPSLEPSTQNLYTFYSPEQLFFLAYAQTFCAAGTYSERMLVDRVHSLDSARVNLPVVNLEGGAAFSRAFNCPRDKSNHLFQPTNHYLKYQNGFATEKCEVW